MIARSLTFLVAAVSFGTAAMAQEPVRWTTLGTNAGPIPNAQRSEPANLLRIGKHLVLVDVGDGAVEQLGKAKIPFEQVDTLFISHNHFDHVGGLFALLGRRYQVVAPNVLTIYGPPGTRAIVDGLVAAVTSAAEAGSVVRAPGRRAPADSVKVIEIADGQTVALDGGRVTAVANTHYATLSAGTSGTPPQSLSLRFDLPGRAIVYTGDTGPSAKVEQLAVGADLLVSEIIDPDAALARIHNARPDIDAATLKLVDAHYRAEHLTPEAVGELAGRAKVKALVITHNPIDAAGLDAARGKIAAAYHGPITFASDLDSF
ncbi:MBL fold metallo-hydrolase [Novosphingobium sp. BL-8H]|uniref:MBL fold metallo-hydrolase n=1 Tax=Novosphingobium sp. BL-8H TaxID=3127640 RepID=UPI003757AD06